jgi:hypothetical protein
VSTRRRSRRSQSGLIFATFLLIAAIVELLLSIPGIAVVAKVPGAPIFLTVLGLALLIGIVFDLDRTNMVIAVLGMVVLAATLGLSGTVEAVLVAALMAWLLGAMRRLRR